MADGSGHEEKSPGAFSKKRNNRRLRALKREEAVELSSQAVSPQAASFSEPHALGCLAGALIGDACGAYHQFAEQELSVPELDLAMRLQGGGPYQLNPGQCTDDGELVLCLMQALGESDVTSPPTLDLEKIVAWYKMWVNSEPFDMEDTIGGTLGLLMDDEGTLQSVKEAARTEYADVVSKYSLNRIAPLAVWAAEIDDPQEYRKIIAAETELTHSNPLVIEAAFTYGQAIRYLLTNASESDKARKAFQHAE